MKKFAIASFSLLAILVSVTLLMGSFCIEPAEADNVAIEWGHLNPDDWWKDYFQDEYERAEALCNYIDWWFYANSYYTWDAYWDYTTSDDVGTCLDMQNDYGYVYFVTNWWVGDFHPSTTPSPGPCGHFWLYGDGGDDISDDFVREHATDDGYTTSKQKFNFFWACAIGDLCAYNANGDYYNVAGIFSPLENQCTPPPTNTNTKYGFQFGMQPYPIDCYGMPYAWTGRLDMNLDGYNSNSGSYCYIGFEGASPFLLDYLPGLEDYGIYVGYFPESFYEYALGAITYDHETIADSLDYASYSTYGAAFASTQLYNGYWHYTNIECGDPATGWWFCRMRVFGNGCIELPD